VEAAVVELRNDASLVAEGDQSVDDLIENLNKTVRRWAIGGIVLVSLVCGVGTFFALYPATSGASIDDSWLQVVLLPLVMIGVGGFIGFILGRLAGYGNLGSVLERSHFRLAGLSTPGASAAMRSLEGVFSYAIVATTAICGWVAIWWLMWHFGFDPGGYRWMWETPYLAIWATAFVFFVLCGWRPVRAFNQRLDRIYGGAEARRSIDEMLQQAREDLNALAKLPAEERAADEKELDAFVKSLQARSFRSPLTNDRVCVLIAVANVAAFVVPALLGYGHSGGL
jgi:hypothetical protein